MNLKFFGWKGDQFTISDVIKPIRGDRNVNVEELQYYVRNYAGYLKTEYRVGGTIELLKRIVATGIPVMIEEGYTIDKSYWPKDDLWAGHYLLDQRIRRCRGYLPLSRCVYRTGCTCEVF